MNVATSLRAADLLPALGAALLIALLPACEGAPASGPAAVAWDRDVCDHCDMVISDRRHAAQFRNLESHRVRRFDDIGCALRWLDDRHSEWEAVDEFWVRELSGERWIPAGSARYTAVTVSPMDYGFGATLAATEKSITLGGLAERIRGMERERRSVGR